METVFDCERDKFPGPDGFSLAVFQDCWDIVKNDLISVMTNTINFATTMPPPPLPASCHHHRIKIGRAIKYNKFHISSYCEYHLIQHLYFYLTIF